MVCDMTGYTGDGARHEREGDPYRRLVNLIDALAIDLWEDLRWVKHQRQIHVTRLRDLWAVGRRAARHLESEGSQPPFVARVEDGAVVMDGRADWEAFTRGIKPDAEGLVPVTITFDTVERYIRVSPLTPDRDYFILEVPHRDELGQLAGFSSKLGELRGEHAVSILCGYLRLIEAGERAVWRCLLRCEKGRSDAIKAELRKQFAGLEIGFPDPVREPAQGLFARLTGWLFGAGTAVTSPR
jgi:hypothetical protein